MGAVSKYLQLSYGAEEGRQSQIQRQTETATAGERGRDRQTGIVKRFTEDTRGERAREIGGRDSQSVTMLRAGVLPARFPPGVERAAGLMQFIFHCQT